MLEDMLDKEIIQPSVSPWASLVILVPKKNGKYWTPWLGKCGSSHWI